MIKTMWIDDDKVIINDKDIERFESKIEKSSDCWVWTGTRRLHGYGYFWIDGKNARAHRLSYTIYKGDIGDDILVCHKCDIPSCVNPDHLFLGTNRENSEDMKNKKRSKTGESNWNSTITDIEAKEIIRLYSSGNFGCLSLSDYVGCSKKVVKDIVSGKTWNHIKRPECGLKTPIQRSFSENEVRQMRGLYKTGRFTHKQISKMFGCSRSTVSPIIACRTWKHTKDFDNLDHDEMRVYIAAPFFNEKQLDDVIEIENILENADIEFHSPRSVGVLKDMSKEDRMNSMKSVYDSNIKEMEESTHMIQIVNDRDTGTIFEGGYFIASAKPVLMFADDISFVSVMLAMGASSICTDKSKILDALKGKHNEKIGDTI